jgi:Ca2+-binding EF-hand superfamily protein
MGLLPRAVASINVCLSIAASAKLMWWLWQITKLPWKVVFAVIYFAGIFYAYLRVYPAGASSHYNQMEYNTWNINKIIVSCASLVGDTFIVTAHLIVPPHPKFCLRRVRKFFIILHVVSGIHEIAFGILVFFSATPRLAVYGMWIADVGHMVSAIAQVPVLFGIKEVMVPAYAWCIVYKAVCAATMAWNYDSDFWFFATFLMHHVYVWVRIYYKLFSMMGIMSDNIYTIAIILAGMTCAPPAVGTAHVLVLFLTVLLFQKVYLPLRYPDLENDFALSAYWKGENARNVYENDGFKNALSVAAEKEKASWYMLTPQEQANIVFKYLDRDHSGKLSIDELEKVFRMWFKQSSTNTLNSAGIETIEKIKRRVGEKGGIDFADFERYVMKCGIYPFTQGIVVDGTAHVEGVHPLLQLAGKSCREKAMLWFDSYATVEQSDGQKAVNLADLTQLFYDYGFPMLYLLVPIIWQITDANHDGIVTFEEFFSLRHTALITPVWKFMEEQHMARVVFETIDSDNSGSIDLDELAEVLMESGLPQGEAELTAALYDDNGDGQIQFAEFFKHFRPLYVHAFGNIEEAVEQARSKDMSKASRVSHIMNSPSRSDMSNSPVLRQRTTPAATADA